MNVVSYYIQNIGPKEAGELASGYSSLFLNIRKPTIFNGEAQVPYMHETVVSVEIGEIVYTGIIAIFAEENQKLGDHPNFVRLSFRLGDGQETDSLDSRVGAFGFKKEIMPNSRGRIA